MNQGMEFNTAVDFLFELEGYGTGPGDTPTMWGITRKWNPGYYARMQAESDREKQREIAKECYYLEYWTPLIKLWGKPSLLFQCIFLEAVNIWEFVEQWIDKNKSCFDRFKDSDKNIKKYYYPTDIFLIHTFVLDCMDHYLSLCELSNPRHLFNRKQFRGWIARLSKIKKWAVKQQSKDMDIVGGETEKAEKAEKEKSE